MAEVTHVAFWAPSAALDGRIVGYLEERQAWSRDTAVAYMPPRPFERRRLARLQRSGVVMETPGGLFYLNTALLDARAERRRGLVLAGACLAGGSAIVSMVAALLGLV